MICFIFLNASSIICLSMADSNNESGGALNAEKGSEMSPREQDQFLPIANMSRIMKKGIENGYLPFFNQEWT